MFVNVSSDMIVNKEQSDTMMIEKGKNKGLDRGYNLSRGQGHLENRRQRR